MKQHSVKYEPVSSSEEDDSENEEKDLEKPGSAGSMVAGPL